MFCRRGKNCGIVACLNGRGDETDLRLTCFLGKLSERGLPVLCFQDRLIIKTVDQFFSVSQRHTEIRIHTLTMTPAYKHIFQLVTTTPMYKRTFELRTTTLAYKRTFEIRTDRVYIHTTYSIYISTLHTRKQVEH